MYNVYTCTCTCIDAYTCTCTCTMYGIVHECHVLKWHHNVCSRHAIFVSRRARRIRLAMGLSCPATSPAVEWPSMSLGMCTLLCVFVNFCVLYTPYYTCTMYMYMYHIIPDPVYMFHNYTTFLE